VKEYKNKFSKTAVEEASNCNQEPDEYDIWSQEQSTLHAIEDEFDHFINASPTNLPSGTTALDWWLDPSNHTNYPSLYRMAINFLFVLPMSAKPKCIFLRTWQTIY